MLMPFQLTPPAQLTLLISVVLAILAVVFRFYGNQLPGGLDTHPFVTLMIGYLVLLAGNLFEGI
jgi:hypothetical protein